MAALRDRVASPIRRLFTGASVVASQLRIIALKARFPGLTTVGRVFIGPGCEIFVAPGSTVRLNGCSLVRDVSLITATGATIDLSCFRIGRGAVIVAQDRVEFGQGSGIAELAVIRDADHVQGMPLHEQHFVSGPIIVGRDVWIGAQSTLLRGITIGDGAVVAAGAVVTSDVPAGALVGGVPARVLRHAV